MSSSTPIRMNTLFDAERVIDAELAKDRKIRRDAAALASDSERLAIALHREQDSLEVVAGVAKGGLELARAGGHDVEDAGGGPLSSALNDGQKAIDAAFQRSEASTGRRASAAEQSAEALRRWSDEAHANTSAVLNA